MRGKDVVGIVTFDLIGLLPTSHIILQWHTGVYGGMFNVIVRNYSSNKQNWLKVFLMESRNGKV